MTTHRSTLLLASLLSLLASHGLASDSLAPWRTWVVFKQFARSVAETTDPGVSVQVDPADGRSLHLFMTRQVLERVGDRLEPVGAVVCEFTFAPRRHRPLAWQEWSFDHPTFERFVDAVERTALFSDLMVTRPLSSSVSWEEA